MTATVPPEVMAAIEEFQRAAVAHGKGTGLVGAMKEDRIVLLAAIAAAIEAARSEGHHIGWANAIKTLPRIEGGQNA